MLTYWLNMVLIYVLSMVDYGLLGWLWLTMVDYGIVE